MSVKIAPYMDEDGEPQFAILVADRDVSDFNFRLNEALLKGYEAGNLAVVVEPEQNPIFAVIMTYPRDKWDVAYK